MAARNSLVEDIRELFETTDLDEKVKFEPKAPAGVKRSPEQLRKDQASAIKAMRARLRTGKKASGEKTTDDEKEADKYRLGTAYRDAGAKKLAAKLGQGSHPDSKKEPEHKEPEHRKHARDAEAASGDAHDAHKTHDQSVDDAHTAMHAHLTAVKSHTKAKAAAHKANQRQSVDHHDKQIQKHIKLGREAQAKFHELSKAEKDHADDSKKASNESVDIFKQFGSASMTEQRRLMGFDDTPIRKDVVAEGSVDALNQILRTNTEHQRLLMGYDNPYPTLRESREEVEEAEEQEEAVRLSTSDDPEHRAKIAKAAKVLKKVKGANVAAFFNRK